MRRVIIPQAMRVIIPPLGNETIGMLKTTSLVLAVPFTLDLQYATNAIANRIYAPIPLLIVAAFWYLVMTSVLMIGQHFLEQYFGRGFNGTPGRHPGSRHHAQEHRPGGRAVTTSAAESARIEPMVRITGLHKEFGPLHILKGIDLDVAPGEVCVLLGPSGSGKSTLLRCINGLEGYQDGSIKLGGMTITAWATSMIPCRTDASSGFPTRKSPPSGHESAWSSNGSISFLT